MGELCEDSSARRARGRGGTNDVTAFRTMGVGVAAAVASLVAVPAARMLLCLRHRLNQGGALVGGCSPAHGSWGARGLGSPPRPVVRLELFDISCCLCLLPGDLVPVVSHRPGMSLSASGAVTAACITGVGTVAKRATTTICHPHTLPMPRTIASAQMCRSGQSLGK